MARVELQVGISHRLQSDVLGVSVPAMNQKFNIARLNVTLVAKVAAPVCRYLDWLINSLDAEKC